MDMVAKAVTKHDFVTETKGLCYFCSKSTSLQYSSTGQESSSTYSLHCLATYLKVDMEKVFTGNEPIDAHLMERVRMSRLKAELCGDCAVLNQRFSKIFQQLEKVEMEATSCLDIIHEKLKRAVTFTRAKNVNCDLNEEWTAKLEISEALRADTIHKCSRKLCDVRPITKIERLTWKQINAEKGKLKLKNDDGSPNWSDAYYVTNNKQYDDAEGGSPTSISVSGQVEDEADLNTDYILEVEMMKEDNMTEGLSVSESIVATMNIKMEESSVQNSNARQTDATENRSRKVHKNAEKPKSALDIPPPLTVDKGVGIDDRPEVIKNLKTGKYKCPICSKEYVRASDLYHYHFKSAHLKMRYTCGTCKKDFPRKHVYERHYLNIHMGVKFKCGKCNKTFSQEGHLKKHLNKFH